MLLDIIYTSIVSLIVIYIAHYLYEYFKKNLTTPKIKDLINRPKQEYSAMYDIINKNPGNNGSSNNNNNNNSLSNEYNINSREIKDELADFFNDLNKDDNMNSMNSINYAPL